MKVAQEEMVKVGRTAIDIAWKGLDGKEATALAIDSGSRYTNGHLLLPFFETRLTIDLDKKVVLLGGKMADETTSILALHYLAGSGPDVPRGVLLPFNQANGGESYYEAFKRRTIDRLAIEFGRQPSSLIRAGGAIGGFDIALGSASIEVRVFPKAVVTLIVWEGDDEVPPSANVLFDSITLSIFPTEDLAVIGSLTIARLIKARNRLSSVQ
jgi:hypothetical protein